MKKTARLFLGVFLSLAFLSLARAMLSYSQRLTDPSPDLAPRSQLAAAPDSSAEPPDRSGQPGVPSDILIEAEPSRPDVTKITYVLRNRPPGETPGCPCPGQESSAYTLANAKWNHPSLSYTLYPQSSGVDPAQAEAAVMHGFDAWKLARPQAPTPISRARPAQPGPGIAFDGEDTVSWLPLTNKYGPDALSVAVIWVDQAGNMAQFDIAFNADLRWALLGPENCGGNGSATYDIQNAATHEAGHIYGLAHNGGCNLTMNPTAAAGETIKATLAAGDIHGVQAKY